MKKRFTLEVGKEAADAVLKFQQRAAVMAIKRMMVQRAYEGTEEVVACATMAEVETPEEGQTFGQICKKCLSGQVAYCLACALLCVALGTKIFSRPGGGE